MMQRSCLTVQSTFFRGTMLTNHEMISTKIMKAWWPIIMLNTLPVRLKVCNKDLKLSPSCGILSLKMTKSGVRAGADEAIALGDTLCLQFLETRCVERPAGDLLRPYSAQQFREQFRRYQTFFWIMNYAS